MSHPNYSDTTQDSRFGGMGRGYERPEYGTVSAVQPNTYTYSVRTLSGRPLQGIPRKRASPNDLALLPVGTTVVVRYDLGVPYIDGVLDMPAAVSLSPGIQATEASVPADPSNTYDRGNYRAPHEPSDLLGGDHLIGNASGVRVGALAGGVALLKASGGAQVRAHALGDVLEIISRNYRHITDMGLFEIKNDQGRINMKFRGASDQTNEAGADEEHWTVKMDLGAEGDLFNFELCSPQGQTLFKLHVDSAGRCQLFGLDGVIVQSGAASGEGAVQEQGGDLSDVVHGNRATRTDGDVELETRGDLQDVVDGVRRTVTGADTVTATGRDLGLTVTRNASLVVGGDATDAATPAVRAEVRNGDVQLHMGQPSNPRPGVDIRTVKGDLGYTSTAGGNVKLTSRTGQLTAEFRKVTIQTSEPDSVVIGGRSLQSHIAKFEELEQMLEVLFQLLDTHTHPIPSGLSGATPIFSGTLGSLVQRIRSIYAGVGG